MVWNLTDHCIRTIQICPNVTGQVHFNLLPKYVRKNKTYFDNFEIDKRLQMFSQLVNFTSFHYSVALPSDSVNWIPLKVDHKTFKVKKPGHLIHEVLKLIQWPPLTLFRIGSEVLVSKGANIKAALFL